MDLTHSKTADSEVYNIPDSKSSDMIQPPKAGDGQNLPVAVEQKSK